MAIVEDKKINEDLMTFHLKKLNIPSWILMMIIIILPLVMVLPFFGQFPLSIIIIGYCIAIFITPFVWKLAGNSVLKKIFLKNFEICTNNKEVNIIRKILNSLIGINISPNYKFFLEASVEDINLNSIKSILSKRIFNVTSASIGICFSIATIALFFIPPENIRQFIGAILAILLLAPLMLFWLIPMIWSIQDANIKYYDNRNNIADISDKISKGTLRKLLGITGIALAFSFFLDVNLAELPSNASVFTRYLFSTIFVVMFMGLNIGVSLISALVYLNLYHKNIVNDFRMEVAKILPIGVTAVREINEDEKFFFKSNSEE